MGLLQWAVDIRSQTNVENISMSFAPYHPALARAEPGGLATARRLLDEGRG